jgi:hypothetical protein
VEKQNYFWLAISIAILVAAAALWVLQKRRLRRARGWPTEAGRVEATAIRFETSGAPPNASSAFVAGLKYSYTVQGVAYSGGLNRRFMLKGRAERWIGRYRDGSPLAIRYNPSNAKDSVLFEDEQSGPMA